MGKSFTSTVAGMKTFQAIQLVHTGNLWIGLGKSTPWNETDEVPEVGAGMQLLEPVGYKKAEKVQFVVPDDHGEIVQLGQKWKVISEQEALNSFTRWVYLAAWIHYNELPEVSYRQTAVITDLTFKPDTLPGKLAVLPNEVENSGYALVVNNRSPIQRTADQREFIEFIVEF